MKRKFAAFDIDGTFFRSHLFYEVVLELARNDNLHPKLNKKTLQLYDKWKDRTHSKAFEDFDNQTIHSLKSLLTEIDPRRYDEAVEKVIKPRLNHVYMYPKKLLKELKEQGYFILAISGSRIEEVRMFAPYHGFDDWIGQEFERSKDGSKYTGVVRATFRGKHIILANFVKKHDLTYENSYAIGDTGSDISMLSMVEHPIAFNPNDDLLKEAKRQGWKIVIERKSIAFELERKNGHYILASSES